MICINQSILQLYQGYKSLYEKVSYQTISISKYNPLAGRSYIKLPKELDHQRKGLINIQNIDDNECFKWCFLRYLYPTDYHRAGITKDFAERLDFKDIKFPVKDRDIHKTDIKNSISMSFFGYEAKKTSSLCIKKIL